MCLAIPVRVVELLGERHGRGRPGRHAQGDLAGAGRRRAGRRLRDPACRLRAVQARPRGGRSSTLALFAEMAKAAAQDAGMKYIDEFRDGELARNLAAASPPRPSPAARYRLMEFCGGHTHAISRYGIADLLPPTVRMIHGPGCPVCVLPIGRIDLAIRLALRPWRDPVHLWRLPARAGLRRPVAAEGQGARRRRAHGLFDRPMR